MNEIYRGNNLQILSDQWLMVCDPDNTGKDKRWFESGAVENAKEAVVPGIIQQTFPDYHGVVWYWNKFTPEVDFIKNNKHYLCFGFVDYYAEFWLNGIYLGSHEGGEMLFELDATRCLKQSEENLLSVRLINPTEQNIDGFTLAETPHSNKAPKGLTSGMSFNYGGIMYPVKLCTVPKIRVSDSFVIPDIETGCFNLNISILNETEDMAEGCLNVGIGPKLTGFVVDKKEITVKLEPGESNIYLSVKISSPHFWSLEDPYLYFINVNLNVNAGEKSNSSEYTTLCGLRDFRVENGFFRLNGKRIFIRSTHTGNHQPVIQFALSNPNYLYKDLIYAKASGFNMVRFIANVAYPEQLQFCDEIGLLVYEENKASWCLRDSPKMKERFDASTLGMIRRDRNHPSVVIWGLLNEVVESEVAKYARSILDKVRELDKTRLVLYSSGRWDCQLGTGSICNPNSTEWQFEWGNEENQGQPLKLKYKFPCDLSVDYPSGFCETMGDIHIYPLTPHSDENSNLIRTLGYNTKPLFLSEYGVASLFDVVRCSLQYEETGFSSDMIDFSYVRSMAEKLESDWIRLGMNEVYPFITDFFRDSQYKQTYQRDFTFNLVRSNPRYCGYNLTGMLDHGYSGEGLWTFFREWKPGIMDVLQNGWAPLRWCLFVEPMHIYANRPFRIEAVLANEDILKPGDYPVCFRISGPNGILWEKRTIVSIPSINDGEDGPLSIPVINESIILDISSGEYTFAAFLEKGGAPAGGRLKFFVSNNSEFPSASLICAGWGIDDSTMEWLEANHIVCKSLDEIPEDSCVLILIGNLSNKETSSEEWVKLYKKIAMGSTAVFLSPSAFKRGEESTGWLPLEKKGRCYKFRDWLYHKECVLKRHPYFHGLQGNGISDLDYYGRITPLELFEGQDTPDEVMAAAFATGYPMPGGYACGILLGAYRLGAGRLIINSFNILENLDKNPAADRLLINILSYEKGYVQENNKCLPESSDEYLKRNEV